MEEQKSIFENESNVLSAKSFYSIARWSNFIGVIMLIAASLFFILGIVLRSMIENIFAFTRSTVLYPFLGNLQSMPTVFWTALVLFVSLLIALLGILFIQIAKNGKDYYYTRNKRAFIKAMGSIRLLFLLGTIGTILTSIPTLLNIFKLF